MLFSPTSPLLNAEELAAVALAERQLRAYNDRDIDAFCACYAPRVRVSDCSTLEQPTVDGMDAFRARYAKAFVDEPQVRCEVVHRHVFGRFVTDFESLTGFKDGKPRQAVAVYEMQGEVISRVVFLR